MIDIDQVPAFAVCGYSGAGKTTLLIALVSRLRARGLRTIVVKHDVHGLAVDRRGKDSQRLYAAGADVFARDAEQSFCRRHRGDAEDLAGLLHRLRNHYDVILVEGHKRASLPRKLWLRRHARDLPPENCGHFARDLGRDIDRAAIAWTWIEEELAELHRARPTWVGILIGGQSMRMGRSKHLVAYRGRSFLEHIVAAAQQVAQGIVLLGAGAVPRALAKLDRLPDTRDQVGPLAGMCAAMRWNPTASWIFLACDAPRLDARCLSWLVQQARPGVWAVLPRHTAMRAPEPFPGWYDARALALLENARGPSWLSRDARTLSPVVPASLRPAFADCDTPAQLRRLVRDSSGRRRR